MRQTYARFSWAAMSDSGHLSEMPKRSAMSAHKRQTGGLTVGQTNANEQWDGTALSHLPTSAIANEFAYNRVAPGPFGLRAEMGAMATITLPATRGADA